MMKNWFLNNSVLIIESVALVNARNVSHCSAWEIFLSIRKQRYSFLGWGSLWPRLWVVLLSWYFIDSDPNRTLEIGAAKLWFFWGRFKILGVLVNRDVYSRFFVCGMDTGSVKIKCIRFYYNLFLKLITLYFWCNFLLNNSLQLEVV